MKQKLFTLWLACLLCAGMWAQEKMTLRLLDLFDTPVPNATVRVMETDSDNSLGEFTTDDKGTLTLTRTNRGPLELRMRDMSVYDLFYVAEWDGSDDPVQVRLEPYVLFTFHWTDCTPELKDMVSVVINGEWLRDWDDDNTARVLVRLEEYGDASAWWVWDGAVLGRRNKLYDVSRPAARNITAALNIDSYAHLTVRATGRQGEELSASARLQGNGLEGSTGNSRYVPAGSYLAQVEASPMDVEADPTCYLPSAAQEISLRAGDERELTADYRTDGHDATLTVLDVDGKPLTEANVTVRQDNGNNTYAQADGAGVVRMAAFPGTYRMSVERCYNLEECTDAYHVEHTLTVAAADVRETISMADYYARLAFEVTLPPAIADPNGLAVRVNTQNLPYDGRSGRYENIVRRPQEDHEKEWEVYGECIYPMRGRLADLSQTTVKVDLSDYRARVHLVAAAPADYRLEQARVSKCMEDGGYDSGTGYWTDDSYEGMYMAPGEYRATVTLADRATGQLYPLPAPIAFTVGDADMEVPCAINDGDFNRLTVTLVGFDGRPIADDRVHVNSYSGGTSFSQSLDTDAEGQAVFTLPDGEYHVSAFTDHESAYPQYNETVELTDDKDLRISCEGYRPLEVTVDGDLLADFRGNEYDGWYNMTLTGKDVSYLQCELRWKDGAVLVNERACYLPAGTYEYELNLRLGENYLNTRGVCDLRDGNLLRVSLPADGYSRVTLRVVDGNGMDLTDGDVWVYATGSDEPLYNVQPQTVVYLPDGDYKAKHERHFNGNTLVAVEDFTVAGDDRTVTLRCLDARPLRVWLKLPEAARDYLDRMEMTIRMDGEYVCSESPDFDSETCEAELTFMLSPGTYTYEIYEVGKGEVTVTDDEAGTDLRLDYGKSPYLRLDMADESGNPITESEEMEMTGGISREGYFFDQWSEHYFGVATPGMYKVWGWAYGYRVAEQSVTVADKGESLTLTLSKADEDNFTVYFGLDDEYFNDNDHRLTRGTITFGNFGTRDIGYINLFADIPAGTYPYTLQVEGFAPRTGTVTVDEAHQWEDEDTPPHIILVELMANDDPTGVGCLTTPDESFRIFPTVAEDVVHISPATTAGGEWTVRIVSASGAVMYTAPCGLTTETAVSVAGLPEGLYLLHLSNGTDTETHKFVKKR